MSAGCGLSPFSGPERAPLSMPCTLEQPSRAASTQASCMQATSAATSAPSACQKPTAAAACEAAGKGSASTQHQQTLCRLKLLGVGVTSGELDAPVGPATIRLTDCGEAADTARQVSGIQQAKQRLRIPPPQQLHICDAVTITSHTSQQSTAPDAGKQASLVLTPKPAGPAQPRSWVTHLTVSPTDAMANVPRNTHTHTCTR